MEAVQGRAPLLGTTPRANVYRRMNEIPYDWGTAVNVQSMVFGNSGDNSGTGVAFTRNPATGEKALFGEYLINAQGEDVVAGVRTPSPISKLHEEMPAVYEQFAAIADRLEKHYKDMQDMEFTIENGKLYMLQTRNGKRTAAAALKVAVDLVDEGMIDEKEAVCRVDPKQLDALLHPTFDAEALKKAPGRWQGPGRLPPVPPAAAWCSPPRRPRSGTSGARRSSWSAWRPLPRTSRACRSPRAS